MKTVYVTYYVHSTSVYNEKHRMAGWRDVPLSELGKRQSLDLARIVKRKRFDAVFSSDLSRALDTANVAFGDRYRIKTDKRLRECDYGKMAGKSSEMLDSAEEMIIRIDERFPGGESYRDVEHRIRSFIGYLCRNYSGKRIAIVSHQAPQLSFEVITEGKGWKEAIRSDWRLKDKVRDKSGSLPGWRPGWKYTIIA